MPTKVDHDKKVWLQWDSEVSIIITDDLNEELSLNVYKEPSETSLSESGLIQLLIKYKTYDWMNI